LPKSKFDVAKFLSCENEKCDGYGFSIQCASVQASGGCNHTKKTDDPQRRDDLAQR
jgi:hypothetical protein